MMKKTGVQKSCWTVPLKGQNDDTIVGNIIMYIMSQSQLQSANQNLTGSRNKVLQTEQNKWKLRKYVNFLQPEFPVGIDRYSRFLWTPLVRLGEGLAAGVQKCLTG